MLISIASKPRSRSSSRVIWRGDICEGDDEMNGVQSLIGGVARLLQFSKALKNKSGDSFNVFRLCQVDHYETMHSRIIAEFLDPNGAHTCGDVFLERFLKLGKVRSFLDRMSIDLGGATFNDAVVTTEESYENGRCDIVVHWRDLGIVIENKIYASDQPRQLRRYFDDIQKHSEKPCILYLTLDGHEATSGSSDGIEYVCISYKNEIVQWLTESAQKAFDKPYIRESLLQYRDLVKVLTTTGEDREMKEEIVKDITSSCDAFRAACAIKDNLQEARAAVARKIMEALDKEIKTRVLFREYMLCHDELYNFVEDTGRSRQYWHSFSIKKVDSANAAFSLSFEFQDKGSLTNLFMGVTKRNCDRKRADVFYANAEKDSVLKKKYGFYLQEGNGWMYGTWASDSEIRFWSDALLAKVLDAANMAVFVKKLADHIEIMLKEAEGVSV